MWVVHWLQFRNVPQFLSVNRCSFGVTPAKSWQRFRIVTVPRLPWFHFAFFISIFHIFLASRFAGICIKKTKPNHRIWLFSINSTIGFIFNLRLIVSFLILFKQVILIILLQRLEVFILVYRLKPTILYHTLELAQRCSFFLQKGIPPFPLYLSIYNWFMIVPRYLKLFHYFIIVLLNFMLTGISTLEICSTSVFSMLILSSSLSKTFSICSYYAVIRIRIPLQVPYCPHTSTRQFTQLGGF